MKLFCIPTASFDSNLFLVVSKNNSGKHKPRESTALVLKTTSQSNDNQQSPEVVELLSKVCYFKKTLMINL
jgi:hypothetical protein